MKYKSKHIYLLLCICLFTKTLLAQSPLETQNGYQVSKANGAVAALMKWKTFKGNGTNDPVTDPEQKLLNQIGQHNANAYSVIDVDYEFYGGEAYKGHNIPYAAVTDSEGNTYVTGGSTNENQPSGDFFTIKINSDGEIIWENRETSDMYAVTYGMQVTIDHTGNIIVSGLDWNGNDLDIRLVKYSPDGSKLWESTYDHGNAGLEIPNALTTGTDGSIYITGIAGSETSVDFLTLKYNSNGVLQWQQTENPAGEETWNEATAIAVDANDNVVIIGYSPNAEGWLNYHTVKYNSEGTKQWEQAYNYTNTTEGNPSEVTNSTPASITTDANGNVYVTGTFDTAMRHIGTIKYTTDGSQEWIQAYRSGTDETRGLHIAVYDDTVYVEGAHEGGFADDGTVLISYTTDGTQNWVHETNNLIQNSNGSMTFDTEGNIIVAASGMTQGEEAWLQDVAARAYQYTPEGTLLGESAFIIATTTGMASMGDMAGAGVDASGNIYFSVASFYTAQGTVFETVKSTFANSSPEPLWNTVYSNVGAPAATMLNSIADGQGNTISTGSYDTFGNQMLNNNYFLTKHNEAGELVWNLEYNAANGNAAEGIIANTDENGNIFVCLLPSFEAFPPVLKVMKIDPDGAQLWSTNLELSSPSIAVLEPHTDGSVYLGGTAYENDDSTTTSFVGIKLNADGSEAWTTYAAGISGNNISTISNGKVTPDGELILTGKHGNGTFLSQQTSLTAVKFNSEGTLDWMTPVTSDGESSTGTDLYIATDGSIYLNGYTQNLTSYDENILVAKLNASGEVVWTQTYGDANTTERSYTLKPFSDGAIGVVGYSLATTGAIHNVLMKYNEEGTLLWDYASENMYYYNDFHIDGSDVCYIMNQVIIDPFPHRIATINFPIAALVTVDADGVSNEDTFFVGPEYAEFYGERLVPHSDDRLLLAGSVGFQDFYKGTYFFETEHDGTLSLDDGLTPHERTHALGQNFPNPVQGITQIPFNLSKSGKATLTLYDLQGKQMATIASDTYSIGHHTISFDASTLNPGIYLYQLKTDDFTEAKKMVIK